MKTELEPGWYYAYWAELTPADYAVVHVECNGTVFAEKEIEGYGEQRVHHFNRINLDGVSAFKFICKIPPPETLMNSGLSEEELVNFLIETIQKQEIDPMDFTVGGDQMPKDIIG